MKKLIILVIAFSMTLTSCKNELKSISLSQTSVEMKYDGKVQLEVICSPSDLEVPPELVWTSENEKVATVDQFGLVSGNNIGETNIKVKTTDGKFEATCRVTITPKTILFKLPVIQLGKDRSFVKASESRVLRLEKEESLLYFSNSEYELGVLYLLAHEILYNTIVFIEYKPWLLDMANTYLDERFDYAGYDETEKATYYIVNEKVMALVTIDEVNDVILVAFLDNLSEKSGSLQIPDSRVKLSAYKSLNRI